MRIELAAGQRVSAISEYWRLDFDLRHGGALSSIVFPHGSGRNLLLEPLRAAVDDWSDINARKVKFQSSREGDVQILAFSGHLTRPDGTPGSLEFETTWKISPFFVRAACTIVFPQPVEVTSVDVGSTAIRADLDEFGLRPSPIVSTDEWDMATFGKARGAGEEPIHQRHPPINLFFFHRGVEGFDLTTASDISTWEERLAGGSGLGYYVAQVARDSSRISITRQPLRSSQAVAVPAGSYTFAYYLGLPRIVERANRKWRHLSFGNHPWPSDEEIRGWAESGVNIVRHHNDYASDGNFWHDGSWPPYDEKGMAELRRVIATCHRYKILVVPYFVPTGFHPLSPGYSEHSQDWALTVDDADTIRHGSADGGEYGAEMCLETGWLKRLKADAEMAFRELGFDGLYWDGVLPEPCRNSRHNAKWHLGSDEAVSLLAWSRRLLGPNGILIHHVYGPLNSITFENFADLVVNMEEIANSEELLRLYTIPIMTVLAESIPRAPCPSYRPDRGEERSRNRIAQLVLLGMFPWASPGSPANDDTLRLFQAFKAYHLDQFNFRSAYSGDVRTDRVDVMGALYVGQGLAVVVLSNTANEARRAVAWSVKPEALGFNNSVAAVSVTDTKAGRSVRIPVSGLTDGSLQTDMAAYEYRLFEVRGAGPPK